MARSGKTKNRILWISGKCRQQFDAAFPSSRLIFRNSFNGFGTCAEGRSFGRRMEGQETPQTDSLTHTLRHNIETLRERRRREQQSATLEQRLAQRITAFTGSMRFVYLHVAIYGLWILANLGWIPGIRPWDPSFVVLAMVASVEAIFLSTFILITQNRMSIADDRRAELDLQVGLLAEQEITKLVQLVVEISRRLGIDEAEGPDVQEMKQLVKPEAVLDAIEEGERETIDG
jgi:uncharacterized membrane protein